MKKLLLILLCVPMVGFGQKKEIIWEENLDSAFNLSKISSPTHSIHSFLELYLIHEGMTIIEGSTGLIGKQKIGN